MTWQPDDAWLDRRFENALGPSMFGGRLPEERPVAVLLGGQPGAGKSRAAEFAGQVAERPLVVINGDDYRELHPDFKQLQRDDPEQMPVVTQAVSGPLVERSIEYAKAHHVSVLVEGTFRNPEVAMRTAQAFHDAGFDVHAIALAVPPEVSRVSTLGRFVETLGTDQNRWTPPEAHDAAVRGMPTTVEQLAASDAVSRFSVLTRDGDVLADSRHPGPERAALMRSQVDHTHSRPLTDQERAYVGKILEQGQHVEVPGKGQAAANLARLAFARPGSDAVKAKPQTARPPNAQVTRGYAPGRGPGQQMGWVRIAATQASESACPRGFRTA